MNQKLHRKPNNFKWDDWTKEGQEYFRQHINKDPYGCGDCGDVYNKDDLIRHFDTGHRVCRNCIDLYNKLYGKK